VATKEGGEAIVKTALDEFGTVDILINNAGILRDKTLAKMEPAEWKAVRSVHLDGAYYVTRPAYQVMREKGYGRIVMTTSAAGLYGNFGQTNYSAAKMGLVGLMNTLKLEGEKRDVKVNTIAPVARTRLTEDLLPPDLKEKLQPEWVAPMTLYLCSEQVEENGSVFNVGMGAFNRATFLTGPGAVVGDGKNPPTAEQVHQKWDEINSMEGAVEHYNATAALGDMLAAFQPKPKEGKKSSEPAGLTVEGAFDKMADNFQPENAGGVDLVFQFKVTGPNGGEWHAIIKDQTCQVVKGVHSSPTTTIIMSDEDFLNFMQGKLNAMQAYTQGRLKVEGDLMKSQLIEKLFKI
jgi:putative sterol carrier protein